VTTTNDATAPPEEPVGAVVALFGDRADLARRFFVHLATSAVTRGLIGPREVPRLWSRHLLNCAAVSELVPAGASVVDVGSGAGLPGIAIAIARPDVSVTLVEPLQRRVSWLEEVVADLGLGNLTVLRARAEEIRGSVGADVATARAVASLPVLAGWCLPLVRPGGLLLAVKGRTAAEELTASVDELTRLGATGWEIRSCGEATLAEPTTVVCVTAGTAARRPSGGRARVARVRPGPEMPRPGRRAAG
jgi:16S rRNA (guanine527-N7)-methyltransferase